MEISSNNNVPKFIEELVDSLYTNEINKIIESDNVQVDKKMFLMFIVTFFITRLFCEKDSKPLNSDEIKNFMTELLLTNKTKRLQCMELFLQLNNVIGTDIL